MSNLSDHAKPIAFGLSILVIILIIADGVVQINPGERGVVVRFGHVVEKSSLGEGIHLKIPFADNIDRLNVQIQKYEIFDMDSSSKDGQKVFTSCAINYHINPENVAFVRQQLGIDPEQYKHRILEPSLLKSVKGITARYEAEELLTQREQVETEADALFKSEVQKRLPNSIIVDGFSLTNFRFSDSFDLAIENKVKAEQAAKQAENEIRAVEAAAQKEIKAAEGKAAAIRLLAEAEAEAIRIRANALRENYEVLQLNLIEKWNGRLPLVVSGGTESNLLINPFMESVIEDYNSEENLQQTELQQLLNSADPSQD